MGYTEPMDVLVRMDKLDPLEKKGKKKAIKSIESVIMHINVIRTQADTSLKKLEEEYDGLRDEKGKPLAKGVVSLGKKNGTEPLRQVCAQIEKYMKELEAFKKKL
ncbi:uncharacterized protein LOC110851375 isoform X1 [Folsomia candida]|uniref:uncharacterized protein LOC110851375 isoform X1 n=1 Tax=Folsomia candida TaxID=158441 RepID=UPI000B9065BB|nr:uncharacterized protein LOC110851375 isoform X1 [Folsomia candida]